MRPVLKTLSAALLLTVPLGAQHGADRRFRLDPVVLQEQGLELPGRADLTASWGRFEFCFASAEGRARFVADPERWGVQVGGACARMGPLSGEGRAGLWAVHDGRLYFFASEGCRSTFLGEPERMLPHDHAPHPASAEEIERGGALRDQLLSWAGGVGRLGRLEQVLLRSERQVEEDGQQVSAGALFHWDLRRPPGWRQESWWGGSRWWRSLTADGGRLAGAGEIWTALPAQRRAMHEERAHSYLGSLEAALRPDTFVASAGRGRLGEREVEWLQLAFDRVVNHLALDPATGEVLALSYCGVGGPRLFYGKVERRYLGFRSEDGLQVPAGYSVWFDGERQDGQERSFQLAVVDPGRAAGG
ncbi:MAG: hypothetical protein ISR76_08760 [Planctomycetes bacterium]|nr:hypothetical protein [Planctomycetota bacterium]MBL7009074.1 hypothetical protein [Planctomycetota bacterium]